MSKTVKNLLLRVAPGLRYTNRNRRYRKYDIGDYTYGFPRVVSWNEGAGLKIGRFCSIAENVSIFLGGEHRTDWVTTYPFSVLDDCFSHITGHPSTKGDVEIGNDVWIGWSATLMSGIRVGDGAVIGAFAVVARDVKPYEIVAGNPARHIRPRFSEDIVEKLLAIRWWDWDIEKIRENVPHLLQDDIEKFVNLHYPSAPPQE